MRRAFTIEIQIQSKLLGLIRELRRAFLMTMLVMVFLSLLFLMTSLTVLLDQAVIRVPQVIGNTSKQRSV